MKLKLFGFSTKLIFNISNQLNELTKVKNQPVFNQPNQVGYPNSMIKTAKM